VTTGAGDIDRAEKAWRAVRADDTIQYTPIQMPKAPQPPGWLRAFFEWLNDLLKPIGELFGMSWPVFRIVLIAAAVLLVVLLLWRMLGPALRWRPRPAREEDEEWMPSREQSIALLEEADRLASEGRYAEATHLLLQRSVGQISAARPDWVEPSSTARELAALPALPDRARRAFAVIAERVEHSLFALRALGPADWEAARGAYADFALERLPGGAG
jgi:hypothetical protein